jgi:hypothetical protein
VGLAACSSEMVAAHSVKVLAVETSAFGSLGVVLESLVVVPGSKRTALALAPAVSSSVVV